MYYLAMILCLLRPSAAASSSAPTSSSTQTIISAPFSSDKVANLLINRCGRESPALWSFEGTLTDPLTGKVVAEVEGLELAKSLPIIKPSSQLSGDNDQSILGALYAKKLLFPQKTTSSTPQWDSAMTILSRRLFCYRRPSSNTNENASAKETKRFSPYNSLLTSLRLRPDGPLRHLSPWENVALYDCAITYISRNQGREMTIFSERAGRCSRIAENGERDRAKHCFMGTAQSDTSSSKGQQQSSSVFDFAVHAQRMFNNKSVGGPMLPHLTLSPGIQSGATEEVVISPPRSRFLQFGKGDGSATDRKYGSVRETYNYIFDHDVDSGSDLGLFGRIKAHLIGVRRTMREEEPTLPQCSVRYTRYGEAPPWYAPGRSCTLELRGKRVTLPNGIEDVTSPSFPLSHQLPPLASWASSKCNFWSGWPSIFSTHGNNADETGSEKELGRQAVKLFCNKRQPSIDPLLDDYPVPERSKWLSSAENALSKMESCINRISKSFMLSVH